MCGLAAAVAFAGACGAAINPPSAGGSPAPTPPPTGVISSPPLAGGLAYDKTGFILTDRALLEKNPGGAWHDITPTGSSGGLGSAFVLDSTHVWAVSNPSPDSSGRLRSTVYASSNGGATWTRRGMAVAPSDHGFGPLYLTFVDVGHGWLVVDEGSHGGFSYASLYRTSDGGGTWSRMVAPQSAAVSFANASDGISSSGPASRGAYITHDGGQTWTPLNNALPSPYQYDVFGYPRWVGQHTAVIPAYLLDSNRQPQGVGFYVTADNGRSWQIGATMPVGSGVGLGMPLIAVGLDSWLVAEPSLPPAPQSQHFQITTDHGKSWHAGGNLPSGAIDAISFADQASGWVTITTSGCKGFKTDCYSYTGLYQTDDGGDTWSQVALPSSGDDLWAAVAKRTSSGTANRAAVASPQLWIPSVPER